jgi:cytochrome oxidase Cu insertion factor (SCO1/SenC/PrrC family)
MKLRAKTWRILASALFVVFVALLSFNLDAKSRETTSDQDLMASMKITRIAESPKAPDFVLKDLEGKSYRLSDLRGKVVLINFWTTW